MNSDILSIFTFPSSFLILLLGSFVFFKGMRMITNKSFFIFTISVFIWLLFYSFAYLFDNISSKLFLFKLGYMGIILIPITWYHFTISFLHYDNKKLKSILVLGYGISTIFIFLLFFTDLLIKGLFEYSWGYYPNASIPSHLFFLGYFNSYFTLSILLLLFSFWRRKKLSPLEKVRRKYVFIACIVGILAAIDFIPNYVNDYNFKIVPFGFIFMIGFCLITTYAILRYRLMDVRVAMTRAGIFLSVYALVLGLPFWIGYRTNFGVISFVVLFILATAGPLVYRMLQKKAESVLLAQQKYYQKVLLQAAEGMVRQHDLDKLLKLIVYSIKRIMKIKYAAIFFHDQEEKVYILKAVRDHRRSFPKVAFDENTPLISYIKNRSLPFVSYEMPQSQRKFLEEEIGMPFDLVVPSVTNEDVLGFMVLGEKSDKRPYTQDDINVFSILSHQASLAIENCLFLQKFRKTQEQIYNAEKLASIGGMADGVAHQIRNRLNQFSVVGGELKFEITDLVENNTELINNNPGIKKSLDYLVTISDSIVSNVKKTAAVIDGILNFARVEEKETFFSDFDLREVIDLSLELLKVKHQVAELPLEIELENQDIYGVKSQIMEAIHNLIDNAYEAIQEKRKYRLNEEEQKRFKPHILIKLSQKDDSSIIQVTDNGIGIKETDKHKVFAPFFTTKSSFTAGTGIGMYIVKRMVEENHKGKIWFESKYMEGTTFFIELPKRR